MSNWDSVVKRVTGQVRNHLRNNADGACVVQLVVLCDSRGEPLVWLEPITKRIEPSNAGKERLLAIISETI